MANKTYAQVAFKLKIFMVLTWHYVRRLTERGQRKFWERRIFMICICREWAHTFPFLLLAKNI